MTITIIIDYDPDPDFTWLEQDIYNPTLKGYDLIYRSAEDAKAKRNPIDGEWYRDPNNHVSLEMLAFNDEGKLVDALSNIDFLLDAEDWTTGTFERLSCLARWPYLQELAKDMGLEG